MRPATGFVSFTSDDGIGVPAVTIAQMAALARAASAGSGARLAQMVENAGRNAAEWVMEMAGDGRLPKVLVLAGPDTKGACGLCAARHLANHGVHVLVALTDPENCCEATARERAAFAETGSCEIPVNALPAERPDLVIDALLGYAASRPPSGRTAAVIEEVNALDADIVSLDLPSGLDATTGTVATVAVTPHATVTFALPYTGLHESNAGEIILADVGIPAHVFARAGIRYTLPFARRYRTKLSRV